jgi:hypothetical protein
MQGSIKAVTLAGIAILVAIAALVFAGTSLAGSSDAQWNRFENKSMMCSVSKPGGAEGAVCVITSGMLEDWSFIVSPYLIKVQNPSNRIVFKKTNTNTENYGSISWAGWQYVNEGVAVRKKSYTVAAMVKYGGLAGWGILAVDDSIEVTNGDGTVKFHKGVNY